MKVSQFPANMGEVPVDLEHPNRTLLSGLFEEKVKTAYGLRTFLTYIPEGLEYCQPCVVAALPSDRDPAEYLESSGLRDFADREHIFLHLACPEGQWKSDGTDADYLNGIYVAVQARDYYVTMQDNIYLCGIGDASFAAHQAAKRMASEWSGLMTFGDLTGNLMTDHSAFRGEQDQGDGELKIMGEASQLPVWMTISSRTADNSSALDYWKEQNRITGNPLSGDGADEIWLPTPVRMHSEINEEYIAQVRLAVRKEMFTEENLKHAWAYISLARRHRGQGRKCLRYLKKPEACGAVRKQAALNGMTRTWYEYVPDTCTPDKEWPVVFVFHGRGGTAETFFDISCISTVAEERRFIAVIPQAGLYQQKKNGLRNVLLWCGMYEENPIDDIAFVRHIFKDLKNSHRIDERRIYAIGQSSGGMMSDMLSYAAGDLFTAAASWSALRSPRTMYMSYEPTERCVPTMWIYGDQDFLCAGKGEDPVLPFTPSEEMRPALMEKIEKCSLDVKSVQTWETYPITWYAFPDTQGVPMLVVGKVHNMVHANYPEETWISYDQFLSQFTKDNEGNTYYRGRRI